MQPMIETAPDYEFVVANVDALGKLKSITLKDIDEDSLEVSLSEFDEIKKFIVETSKDTWYSSRYYNTNTTSRITRRKTGDIWLFSEKDSSVCLAWLKSKAVSGDEEQDVDEVSILLSQMAHPLRVWTYDDETC